MNARVKVSGREPISLASRCVEAALETALRRAFEVALEIAINEFSRLLENSEKQRENNHLTLPTQHLEHGESNQSSSYSLREDTPQKHDEVTLHAYVDESEGLVKGSFHEISHDGRVRSHEINTSPIHGAFNLSSLKMKNRNHVIRNWE